MPIRITIEGVGSFLTDDLTLDETIAIERETGHSWYGINPFTSGADCMAIMVAFLSRTLDPEVARKQIGSMAVRDVLAAVDVVEEDGRPSEYAEGLPDPKAEGGSATTG